MVLLSWLGFKVRKVWVDLTWGTAADDGDLGHYGPSCTPGTLALSRSVAEIPAERRGPGGPRRVGCSSRRVASQSRLVVGGSGWREGGRPAAPAGGRAPGCTSRRGGRPGHESRLVLLRQAVDLAAPDLLPNPPRRLVLPGRPLADPGRLVAAAAGAAGGAAATVAEHRHRRRAGERVGGTK